ncbi:MAG TPA: HAD-IA family hydrolase [Candidatus Krumholzibacteria bacterium]|nr:HAD-IA family hydrolase [Candidatus Krumholzibacteria bacterium]
MAQRAIDAVIFDLDNTLTDFMGAKESSIRAAAAAMVDAGLPMAVDAATDAVFAVYKARGIEHQKVFDLFLEQAMGRVEDRILAAAVVAYRRARDGALVTYPHAKMVLNRLAKDGYKLAVVSDAPRFEAWLRLVYLGLQHTFDVVLTYDDTGFRKPAPEPFRMALDQLGVGPDRAVVIGDWKERDIVGGRAAGLHTVYARYGDQYSQYADKVADDPTEPDYVVDDLLQLLDVLDRLNGGAAARKD